MIPRLVLQLGAFFCEVEGFVVVPLRNAVITARAQPLPYVTVRESHVSRPLSGSPHLKTKFCHLHILAFIENTIGKSKTCLKLNPAGQKEGDMYNGKEKRQNEPV